jgi:hypothetical protein
MPDMVSGAPLTHTDCLAEIAVLWQAMPALGSRRRCAPRHYMFFKPDFMLDVLKNSSITPPERMFYCDPDIVVKQAGNSLTMGGHGVALCEDVNSPVYPTHPRRNAVKSKISV